MITLTAHNIHLSENSVLMWIRADFLAPVAVGILSEYDVEAKVRDVETATIRK